MLHYEEDEEEVESLANETSRMETQPLLDFLYCLFQFFRKFVFVYVMSACINICAF